MEGAKAEQKEAKRQVGQGKWHGDAPGAAARRRAAAMIRVQAADREPKSKEARIVFYLSCIVRYLRAQSAKEPESARWVGVLDVRVPYGYKGGLLCENTPICLPASLSTLFR